MEKEAGNGFSRRKISSHQNWQNKLKLLPRNHDLHLDLNLESRWVFCYFDSSQKLSGVYSDYVWTSRLMCRMQLHLISRWSEAGSQQHLLQLHQLVISRKRTQVQRSGESPSPP